ncbi:unnamed protein product [Linum trigynum]|uniref:Uncharacterized protein n=1 Tax=Linum trigynum TaxID=586398 RepID=A0AAV2DQ59_9ROSI
MQSQALIASSSIYNRRHLGRQSKVFSDDQWQGLEVRMGRLQIGGIVINVSSPFSSSWKRYPQMDGKTTGSLLCR